MATAPTPHLATYEELIALHGEDNFHEIIHGEIVRKVSPSGPHGRAQLKTGAFLSPFDGPSGGGDGSRPGGWWLASEVDVELGPHDVFRPDIAGWRRDRLPEMPRSSPIRCRPDWTCEVISPSNPERDLVVKLRAYREFGVPHYWILDPLAGTLVVHRLVPDGYLVALAAKRGEHVRAEPFEAIEISVDALFGDEPPQAP